MKMLVTTYLQIAIVLAFSHIAFGRPMQHYEGLAETYMQVFGSNVVANDTAAIPHSPVASPTSTDKESSACKPFVMPRVPAECIQKSGELVCHGYSLYCRFPTDWGVGYDPVGECWTCK
ncbi:hypothetical protein F5Y04DRAFT_266220 [Hypomontagnella monticulosa]|nr:hypothetical protein F5Y04DRAFT_266220 [Hypomontagnella monticulosa]